ncbi:MAG: MFS transporter [Gemmatimonadaceae bacterium]
MSNANAKANVVARPATSRFRWFVCAMLFAGTTINYIDRQALALLKPILDRELGWTNEQFGVVNSAFFAVYTFSYLFFGWFVTRYGTKLGYAVAAVFWGTAAIGHGLVSGVQGFIAARMGLGFGEGGNFPSAIASAGMWFPRRERALAASLFNAGTNISAIIGPAIVPWVAYAYGWRAAFVVTGVIALVWLAVWLVFYDTPERSRFVSAEELAYIQSDREEVAGSTSVSWLALLRSRQTWAIISAKFFTDPIYWFFLIWLPDFYKKTRGLDIKASWVYLVAIYSVATVWSTAGGWLTGYLMSRGWSLTRARKTGLLVLALCVVPVAFAPRAPLYGAIVLIGIACGSHQAFSANLYALTADLFPKRAVAGVAGMSGMVGSIGGIFFPVIVGMLLDRYKASGAGEPAAYAIIFGFCSTAYVIAFLANHLFAPRYEPVRGV